MKENRYEWLQQSIPLQLPESMFMFIAPGVYNLTLSAIGIKTQQQRYAFQQFDSKQTIKIAFNAK